MLSFSTLTPISVTYVNKTTRKKKRVTKRRRQKSHRQTILRSWWIMKSLVITGLSQISKLFLKLSRKLWLYVSKTTFNNINLMNLYHLRYIFLIRKFLCSKTTEILVHALVSPRLDCWNSLLYNVPKYVLKKLQSAQNAAARLITCFRKYDHVTPVLLIYTDLL